MINKRSYYVNKIGKTIREANKQGRELDDNKFITLISQEAEVSRRIAKAYLVQAKDLLKIKEGSLDEDNKGGQTTLSQ